MAVRRGMVAPLLTLVLLGVPAAAAPAALVFKRADGSAIRFRGTPRVWCGRWEPDVATPSVHIGFHEGFAPGHSTLWQLTAVRRDVRLGRAIRFPVPGFVTAHPHGAELFVADKPNEASTETDESSGSVVFTRATCRRGGMVAFRIHAVAGSELGGGGNLKPISVSGTFRGRVSHAPDRGR